MLHSEIGGEMSNAVMEDVAAALDVKLMTTAAYSPHQNGVNEKSHAIVDLMMTRMLASDSKMTPEITLRWALNGKCVRVFTISIACWLQSSNA